MNSTENINSFAGGVEIGRLAQESSPVSPEHALKGAQAIRVAADEAIVPRLFSAVASAASPDRLLRCRSIWTQHIGFGRENQEDSVLSVHHELTWDKHTFGFDFAVLADGCGGSGGGEFASAITCGEIHRGIAGDLGAIARCNGYVAESETLDVICRAFCTANARVLDYASRCPDCSEMASTAVCVVRIGDRVYVAWAGDSACTLYREGLRVFRTKDHRRIQALIDLGVLSPEEAARHPDRNVITRAIGIRGMDLVPEIDVKEIRHGDLLILSSDGFHEGISDDYVKKQWSSYLSESPSDDSLRAFARALESQSLSVYGGDNLSSVIMFVE